MWGMDSELSYREEIDEKCFKTKIKLKNVFSLNNDFDNLKSNASTALSPTNNLTSFNLNFTYLINKRENF